MLFFMILKFLLLQSLAGIIVTCPWARCQNENVNSSIIRALFLLKLVGHSDTHHSAQNMSLVKFMINIESGRSEFRFSGGSLPKRHGGRRKETRNSSQARGCLLLYDGRSE